MLRVYYLVHLELSRTHLATELSIHQRNPHGIEVTLTRYLDCDRLLVYSFLFAKDW